MSIVTLTVEVCADDTITRACARTLNRALGTSFSGTSTVGHVTSTVDDDHRDVRLRYVDAATLKGADKGRHTREVTRSRNAQARRCTRAFDAAMAEDDAATRALLAEYAYRRAS